MKQWIPALYQVWSDPASECGAGCSFAGVSVLFVKGFSGSGGVFAHPGRAPAGDGVSVAAAASASPLPAPLSSPCHAHTSLDRSLAVPDDAAPPTAPPGIAPAAPTRARPGCSGGRGGVRCRWPRAPARSKATTAFPSRQPNSGSSATRVAAANRPMPGTLRYSSAGSDRVALLASSAWYSASSWAISASRQATWRRVEAAAPADSFLVQPVAFRHPLLHQLRPPAPQVPQFPTGSVSPPAPVATAPGRQRPRRNGPSA